MSDPFVASYILLWALVIITLVGLLGTARQVAVLTSRFPSEVEFPGPRVGDPAKVITGETLSRESIVVAAPYARRTVFLFMSDTCEACRHILPDVEQLAVDATDADVDVWVVIDKEPPLDHPLRDGLSRRLLISPAASADWSISSVPFAFVAQPDGKLEAKGHLPHVEHLRSTLSLPHISEEDASRQPEVWQRERA